MVEVNQCQKSFLSTFSYQLIRNSLAHIRKLLFIFLALFISICNGQNKSGEVINPTEAVKKQAAETGQFLLNKDYKSFVKFIYPKALEMMGGEQKVIEMIKSSMEKMESEGMKLASVKAGEPSKIVTYQSELQCTIPQIIETKVPNGRRVAKSTLIAVSGDNGRNWYFIDTGGEDLQTIKKDITNLSDLLVIPAPEKPVFYNN